VLQDHLLAIRQDLRRGLFSTQAAVSQGIVLRLLQALSWTTFDITVVCPEYSLSGRRVDFALCHPPGRPLIFIEVKPPGQVSTGERQLFEFAFHRGVPMVILTDGQEWQFYLPGEPGDYAERRVYRLDIVEREVDESVHRLKRYLGYAAVCSGEALAAARADYQDVARQRIIRETLPQAFKKLIKEEEELLLEIIADQVENLCGYKPDLDTVGSFLREHVSISSGSEARPAVTRPEAPAGSEPPGPVGFRFRGQWYPAQTAKEVLIKTFEILSEADPTFLERFASLPQHGYRRRFLSKNLEDLYPHNPELARKFSNELSGGWWLYVHFSKESIKRRIIKACEVANVKYGTDLVINLGN